MAKLATSAYCGGAFAAALAFLEAFAGRFSFWILGRRIEEDMQLYIDRNLLRL